MSATAAVVASFEFLLSRSDPANLALLAVVWWRLDRRLRSLRQEIGVGKG